MNTLPFSWSALVFEEMNHTGQPDLQVHANIKAALIILGETAI